MDSSGTCRPVRARRAARSRGVKIELLVSTRNRRCFSTSRSRNSAAPGSAFSSCTSTPSMSVSQHSIGPRSVVNGFLRLVRSICVVSPPQLQVPGAPRHDVTWPSGPAKSLRASSVRRKTVQPSIGTAPAAL